MTTFYERLTGKNRSATQAKDRLRLVLINDRSGLSALELEEIKNEIMQVLSRHMEIDPATVKVQMKQDGREQRLIADIPIRTTQRRKIG
ncbi:MAG: cell division topological specificity factor MinE [Anaerolineaceae bacterium]|nr:cell division topological specificity factor MinE [Anaerolineaceae bacterium]MBN2676709.1 cell division topological specificity factor MinE [Anaerolineaceae bacterium]